jgi:hypothetical protein
VTHVTSNARGFSRELLPVTILILSVLIFFSKIILSGSGLYGSDIVLQFYPWKKFLYDHVWTYHALPFWNPYVFSGTPFIANIQASMFYPLGFLFYIVPTEYAIAYTVILHCVLGATFMYLFARSLSINKAGAFLAAIIFTFNGYFMVHVYAGHFSFVQNYVWIPLVFCFVHRFLQTSHLKWAVAGGLVLGVQILGGFPQIAFYTILGVLAFGLFRIGISLKAREMQSAVRMGLGLVVLLSVGFSLAAIQLLPTLQFTNLSTRAGGVSYDFATLDSLHPKDLLTFLIPRIFGNVVDQTYWRIANWHFWETWAYVGILPICLVFVSTRSPSLRRLRFFFIAIMLVALFVALGKYNPVYPIIHKLPGFSSFRIPAQILFLYVFGLAVVAGIGLNQILEGEWQFGKAFVIFLAVVAVILTSLLVGLHLFADPSFFQMYFKTFAELPSKQINLAKLHDNIDFAVILVAMLFFATLLLLHMFKKNLLNRSVFVILALVVSMIDLGLFTAPLIKTHRFFTPKDKESVIAELSKNPVQGRVATVGESYRANAGLRYGFPSILGYDPLILERYVHYVEASQNWPHIDHMVRLGGVKDPAAKLLRMLNVRQVVLGQGVGVFQSDFPYQTIGNTTIVNIDDYLFPYATIVNKTIIKQEDEALDFMKGKDFDPHKMVVLESEPGLGITHDLAGIDFRASCSVVQYDHERIKIRVSTTQSGYLVLSEVFYPGWEAVVDGKKVPILRGNYLFRVVPLERGEHEVVLRFVSWPFRIGMIVSLLTLACSLWFIVWKRG